MASGSSRGYGIRMQKGKGYLGTGGVGRGSGGIEDLFLEGPADVAVRVSLATWVVVPLARLHRNAIMI